MATGDLPLRSSSGGLQDIQSLLDIFAGKTTTTQTGTTGTNANTTTTSELVDPAKATELISQMLSGTAGLAAVSGAQKAAGLYNSSTNQLLTNDLLARTAGQVAALGATKTTTSNGTNSSNTNSTVNQQKQADAIKAAVAAGIASALKNLTKKSDPAAQKDSGKNGAGQPGPEGKGKNTDNPNRDSDPTADESNYLPEEQQGPPDPMDIPVESLIDDPTQDASDTSDFNSFMEAMDPLNNNTQDTQAVTDALNGTDNSDDNSGDTSGDLTDDGSSDPSSDDSGYDDTNYDDGSGDYYDNSGGDFGDDFGGDAS